MNDMTQPLAVLEPLIGRWDVEVTFRGAPPVGGATMTVEPALGGAFLLQRTHVPVPEAPDGLMVIASDDDGAFRQHYFDSRGVVRLYAMTFDGRTWTLIREQPDFSKLSFAQRYTGTLTEDGSRIDGRWETRHEGGEYELDFEIAYLRAT